MISKKIVMINAILLLLFLLVSSDLISQETNEYWERYGRRTVERLNLASDSNFLDVVCETGALALPAAEIVGSSGRVIGIDLAESLLKLGRTAKITLCNS